MSKHHHLCFAHPGARMRIPFFTSLHFVAAEGCSDDAGIQLVRISLHKNNGRRVANMMNVVDDYNGMIASKNMSEFLMPVSYAGNSVITCFKLSAAVEDNAILKRIDQASRQSGSTYWKWTECASSTPTTTTTAPATSSSSSSSHTASAKTTVTTSTSSTIVSMKDIITSLQLPLGRVSVSRVVKKLADGYASEFGGAILGNQIPLSRKAFVVAEIRRQFSQEFHYMQYPSIGSSLPAEVRHTMADLLGTAPEEVRNNNKRGGRSRSSGVPEKKYVRTNAKKGDPVLDFLVFHALQWNAAGFDSVDEVLAQLHASWPGNGSTTSDRLKDSCFRRFKLRTKGDRLQVKDVGVLLRNLSQQGGVRLADEEEDVRVMHVVDTSSSSLPSPEMVAFMLRLADDAGPKVETVELTGRDVLAGLNHGSVGAYRMPCVQYFIGPFVKAGVVVVCGGGWNGKYVVYVNKIQPFVDEIDKK